MDEKMEIGAGVLRFLKASGHNWDVAFREWIDNALDAGANRIEIRFHGPCLEVEDDGRGCDNLIAMESIARSIKTAGSKSSMYGIGGVMSQIRAASDGRVEVHSIHREYTSEFVIDWLRCMDRDKIEPLHHQRNTTARGAKTMTLIRIPNSKRLYRPELIAAKLGHAYAGEIRRGKRISLVVNSKTFAIAPYEPPPLAKRVDFEFDYDGHCIRGFTGIVEQGVPNPYHGWSVHWCYRVAFRSTTPAGRHLVNGIYGEVNLPEGWQNINPTKDDFAEEADGLWDRITEVSEALLKEADARSTDLELKDALDAASDILTRAVTGRGIKERRPGKPGEEGTKIPTGRGGKRQNFTHTQEGDDPAEEGVPLPVGRAPSLIRVSFVDSQENAYEVGVSGTSRDRTLHVTLDQSRPQLASFRQDPVKLVTLCAPYIAQAMMDRPELRNAFPSFKDHEFHSLHNQLLSRIALAETTKEGQS